MKRLLVIVAMVSSLFGCDSRQEMRDQFKDGEATILTDSFGNKYAATHNFGDSYSIRPIK